MIKLSMGIGNYVQRFYDSQYTGNGKAGKMYMQKNGLIFLTFLGSCFIIGLLSASLGTRYWIISNAIISNRTESRGRIFFGLFCGEKNLNYGIGWRNNTINVGDEMRTLTTYSYWLGTVVCMCASIIFTAGSAVLAVINSATTPIFTLTGIPGLYLSNITSILFQSGAVGLWATAFYTKLIHNVVVLNNESKGQKWTTEGMAFFGLSYWLVLAAIIVQIINVILIYSATSELRQKKKAAKPVIEEKTNGAIMLY